MYLKKYDLSEAVVSDELCLKISQLALSADIAEVFTDRDKNGSNIKIMEVDESLYTVVLCITNNGDIDAFMDEEGISIDNTQEICHLLLETQWIDPKVELPEIGQHVVVKADGDERYFIVTIKFGCEEDMWYTQVDSWIGWLPAGNVVL